MIVCCCFEERLTELKRLISLALPSIILNSLEMGMIVINLIMLGHVGKGDLAGAAIGYAYYNLVWFFIEGVMTSQDLLCGSACGKRDFNAVRYWSYVSACVTAILCSLGTVAFLFSPILMHRLAGANSRTSIKAIEFVLFSIPGLWFQAGYRVIQKYLQAQNIMYPAIHLSILGLGVNVLGNFILLYILGTGFMGFALTTQIARLAMLCGMLWHLKTKALEFDRIVAEVTKIWSNIMEERSVKAACQHPYKASKRVKPLLRRAYHGIKKLIGKRLDFMSEYIPEFLLAGPSSPSKRVAPAPLGSDDDKIKTQSDDDELDSRVFSPMLPDNSSTSSSSRQRQELGQSDDGDGEGLELTEVQLDDQDADLDLTGEGEGARLLSSMNTDARRITVPHLLVGCGKYAVIGLPGGLMLLMEMWSIDLTIMLVAHMGNNALNAHVILLTVVHFFHLSIVFSISIAASMRVSILLGAQQPYLAKTAAWLSVYLGIVSVAVFTPIVYYGWYVIGVLFTGDEYVLTRMSTIAPIVTAFQAAYGLQGVVQGSLRGMGFQLSLAGYNFLGFWVVGIPTGFYMCFLCRPRFGLEGFWYGLLTGCGLLALMLLLQLLLVNWEKETRRSVFRADVRRKNDSDVISIPQPGSFSVGSVSIEHFVGTTEEREMEELEIVEHGSSSFSRIHQRDSDAES